MDIYNEEMKDMFKWLLDAFYVSGKNAYDETLRETKEYYRVFRDDNGKHKVIDYDEEFCGHSV